MIYVRIFLLICAVLALYVTISIFSESFLLVEWSLEGISLFFILFGILSFWAGYGAKH